MQLSTIQPGDRIRLVTFLASIQTADGRFTVLKINLRYSWVGHEPEHMCVAETCEWCENEALAIARRRAKGGKVRGVAPIRDGQTTMIDRAASNRKQLVAA